MNRINEIEIVHNLLQDFSFKNTLTNNFLLSDAYISLISDKKLFWTEDASNLYFIEEKSGYYQLYYHLNDLTKRFNNSEKVPMVMEILYRGEAFKHHSIIEFWEHSGFNQHIVRENMAASYNQLILNDSFSEKIEVTFAKTDQEAFFVKDIILNTFDKYTGEILSLEETKYFIESGQVLCSYYEKQLCGFLQFEVKNNVAWIGHIAVADSYRGKGVAKKLVNDFINVNSTNLVKRFQLWVMQENQAAINMYKKYGFMYGNKSSISLLKL